MHLRVDGLVLAGCAEPGMRPQGNRKRGCQAGPVSEFAPHVVIAGQRALITMSRDPAS